MMRNPTSSTKVVKCKGLHLIRNQHEFLIKWVEMILLIPILLVTLKNRGEYV